MRAKKIRFLSSLCAILLSLCRYLEKFRYFNISCNLGGKRLIERHTVSSPALVSSFSSSLIKLLALILLSSLLLTGQLLSISFT